MAVISEGNPFRGGSAEMPATSTMSLLQRPNDSIAVSCLAGPFLCPTFPGNQAHSLAPLYQRKNWFQTPAGMFHIEEWIRKVTYLLRRTNKQSVTASGSAEEGRTDPPPPVPAQAWKWLRGWVPIGGAGIVSGGRHMREHMEREEKGSLSRERGCSTDGKEQEHPVWCKESLLWNNKNLRHASRGKGSAYNHLIRATMWTVKLKTNEAKPRKRWGGTLPKRVKITFHHEGSCRNWHTCSHPLQDGQHPLVLFHISTFITKYSGSCTYTGELPQAMEGRELIKAYTTAHSAEENQDSGKFKSFPKN